MNKPSDEYLAMFILLMVYAIDEEGIWNHVHGGNEDFGNDVLEWANNLVPDFHWE